MNQIQKRGLFTKLVKATLGSIVGLTLITTTQPLQAIQPQKLVAQFDYPNLWIGLGATVTNGNTNIITNTVWTVQTSTNLTNWATVGYLTNKAQLASDYLIISNVWGYNRLFYRAYNNTNHATNIIGFVPVTVYNGTEVTLANQFNRYNAGGVIDNSLSNLFPGALEGMTVYKYTNSVWLISNFMSDDYGQIWWDNPSITLNPGEGFYLYNYTGTNLFIPFYGDVVLTPTTLPLQQGLQFISTLVPRNAYLVNELSFPAVLGDTIYKWNGATNVPYKLTTNGWSPSQPYIWSAEGFWVDKVSATNWTKTYNAW